jgi:predicted ATPase/DNA-binding SARP family transcriptional activator
VEKEWASMSVEISLFGSLIVCLNSGRTINRFQTRKTAAVLAYLAFYRHCSHPRDALVELHWPGVDPACGRHRLCVALSSLRRQLEPPGTPPGSVLISNRAFVQLNPAAIRTDVAAFEEALASAARSNCDRERAKRLAEAVALCRGALLPGCYETWVLPERERLAEALLRAYSQLIELAERTGDPASAMRWARQAVAVDPLREEGHRQLIRLLTGAGEREAALRQYRELERLLATELALEPEEKTRALIASLADASSPRPCRTPRIWQPLETPRPSLPPRELPAPLSRFFGREAELARLATLLGPSGDRLVTIMGAGGSGKTRLALEAARRHAETWQGAIWFVRLADLTEPGRLPEAIRDGMSLPPSPSVGPLEQVVSVLRQGPALLLLDNIEHLLPEASGLIRTLLQEVATLTCLTTSRRRLDVAGERTLLLSPLPTPEALSGRTEPEQLLTLARCPSVQLYLDRAQAVRPDFELTPANAATVASLCRRLEGIPLALELAAARAGVLTPRQILEQLERPLSFLVRRGPAAEARHRSLSATLAWSYELLSPEVQRFFARLSVFRSGWRLESAETVCQEPRALDYLEDLQNSSLVLAEHEADTHRFRMLKSVWEYAEAQVPAEERAILARRHAAHYLALAEAAEPALTGRQAKHWLQRLEQEHDDLRAALAWMVEREDASMGLRLAGALVHFWDMRRHLAEGRTWLAAVLALPGATRFADLRAKALYGAGLLARRQAEDEEAKAYWAESLAIRQQLGDRQGTAEVLEAQAELAGDWEAPATWALLEECLGIYRGLGDQRGIASALSKMGWVTAARGDQTSGHAFYQRALAIYRELGDDSGQAETLSGLGQLAYWQGDLSSARAHLEESLAIQRELENQWGCSDTAFHLGWVAFAQGDHEGTMSLWKETQATDLERMGKAGCVTLALSRLAAARGDTESARVLYAELVSAGEELLRARAYEDLLTRAPEDLLARVPLPGHRLILAYTLLALGDAARQEGGYEKAEGLYKRSLVLQRHMADRDGMAACLERVAGVRRVLGQPDLAARLFAAAAALRGGSGTPVALLDVDQNEQQIAAVRAALGGEALSVAWAAGRALPLEQAIAEVLEHGEATST